MRLLIPLLGLGALVFALGASAVRQSEKQVILFTGNTLGYLAPCGCSEPMIGGVKRRATVFRSLSVAGRTTILDNDALVDGTDRQSEIKAETLAQLAASMDVTAVNFGRSAARLGPGILLQLNRFSEGRLTTGSLKDPAAFGLAPLKRSGPFLILGLSSNPSAMANHLGAEPAENDKALDALVQESEISGEVPIVMLDGTKSEAEQLAKAHPQIRLIQYNSIGRPSTASQQFGTTLLVTTGEKGKYIVRMEYEAGKFQNYRVVSLTPDIKDDPVAAVIYKGYLKRVVSEKLLEKIPRSSTPAYAGSWSCVSCHTTATKVWKNSHHRWALNTLEKVGHDRDPDCVSCHVVGLQSTRGFKDRVTTPALAGVGCESCHGPAATHVRNPAQFKLKKLDSKACLGCHNPENSPNFNFNLYWQKIKH